MSTHAHATLSVVGKSRALAGFDAGSERTRAALDSHLFVRPKIFVFRRVPLSNCSAAVFLVCVTRVGDKSHIFSRSAGRRPRRRPRRLSSRPQRPAGRDLESVWGLRVCRRRAPRRVTIEVVLESHATCVSRLKSRSSKSAPGNVPSSVSRNAKRQYCGRMQVARARGAKDVRRARRGRLCCRRVRGGGGEKKATETKEPRLSVATRRVVACRRRGKRQPRPKKRLAYRPGGVCHRYRNEKSAAPPHTNGTPTCQQNTRRVGRGHVRRRVFRLCRSWFFAGRVRCAEGVALAPRPRPSRRIYLGYISHQRERERERERERAHWVLCSALEYACVQAAGVNAHKGLIFTLAKSLHSTLLNARGCLRGNESCSRKSPACARSADESRARRLFGATGRIWWPRSRPWTRSTTSREALPRYLFVLKRESPFRKMRIFPTHARVTPAVFYFHARKRRIERCRVHTNHTPHTRAHSSTRRQVGTSAVRACTQTRPALLSFFLSQCARARAHTHTGAREICASLAERREAKNAFFSHKTFLSQVERDESATASSLHIFWGHDGTLRGGQSRGRSFNLLFDSNDTSPARSQLITQASRGIVRRLRAARLPGSRQSRTSRPRRRLVGPAYLLSRVTPVELEEGYRLPHGSNSNVPLYLLGCRPDSPRQLAGSGCVAEPGGLACFPR